MSEREADIWVTLHVVARLDPELAEDEEYVLDRASDAIYSNDVLGADLRDFDWRGVPAQEPQ